MTNLLRKKRSQIDALDTELSGLLAERLSLAASMAGLKKEDRDLRREALVLERVAGPIKGCALRAAVRAVYLELMKQGRLLQAAAGAALRAGPAPLRRRKQN
jgi:chorismate mutase